MPDADAYVDPLLLLMRDARQLDADTLRSAIQWRRALLEEVSYRRSALEIELGILIHLRDSPSWVGA